MAPQSRPRIKRHETKGFGFGCVDDLPNIDAHGGIDDLQFVDESNIHTAKDILEQLGRFSRTARGKRDYGFYGPTIEGNRLRAASRSQAPNQFWNHRHFARRVAWVFALGRKRQMKVNP